MGEDDDGAGEVGIKVGLGVGWLVGMEEVGESDGEDELGIDDGSGLGPLVGDNVVGDRVRVG